jgi:NAD(P)-dependent dehydrogenase (short-subunit alcohol dehydrogenase family)
MSRYTFDGRVAVVTGAGRGIGRAHALLLAERGAKVVVNDLGGSMTGEGADEGPAQSVVQEIVAGGGDAVADTHDVSTTDGGQAIIDTAIERFGRIDVLVANAGIAAYAAMPEIDLAHLQRHLSVHLLGSFTTMRAAWPHFVDQGYGRVVLTTSTGLLGLPNSTCYATAKAALIGLARSSRLAGQPHGITVNLIAPAAFTRMAGGEAPKSGDAPKSGEAAPSMEATLPSDAVAPMVAYLAHEECGVSGEIYTAGAGRFARLFIGSTEGYLHEQGTPTIEDVADHFDTINDETGYYVPADLMAWSGAFLKHQFA